MEKRIAIAARKTDGTSAFIFRKKHKNDTTHVAMILTAHYSVVLRTVSSRIRLRG